MDLGCRGPLECGDWEGNGEAVLVWEVSSVSPVVQGHPSLRTGVSVSPRVCFSLWVYSAFLSVLWVCPQERHASFARISSQPFTLIFQTSSSLDGPGNWGVGPCRPGYSPPLCLAPRPLPTACPLP